MTLSAQEKGKGKLLPSDSVGRTDFSRSSSPSSSSSGSSSSPHSSSESESDGEDSSEEESEDEISQEYLDSLLEEARRSIAAKAMQNASKGDPLEDDIIGLDDPESVLKYAFLILYRFPVAQLSYCQRSLPPLDPGTLPTPYIALGKTPNNPPSAIRDLDAERVMKSSSSLSVPTPPAPPPELTKSGKPLTKKEKKAVCHHLFSLCSVRLNFLSRKVKEKTAGPKWFDLPAPPEADRPRLYKEYDALRLRNQLDPKRFYRKDPNEGRGIKGLPKHFAVRFQSGPAIYFPTQYLIPQIGTVIPTSTPFGGPSGDNLPRSARKRTLVDELVDDAEARHYAKRKFNELQSSRAAKGRGTLAARKAARKPKW